MGKEIQRALGSHFNFENTRNIWFMMGVTRDGGITAHFSQRGLLGTASSVISLWWFLASGQEIVRTSLPPIYSSRVLNFTYLAVLSYFLGGVLDTAGFRSSVSQLNINLVKDCLGLAVAVLGALCVEKFGRRPLLIGTNLACSMVWVGMVVATSRYAASIPVGSTDKVGTDTAAAWASLAMIFLFAFVFAFGFTPLQTLYPVEVLSFELRAKGMGFSNFAVNAGKSS